MTKTLRNEPQEDMDQHQHETLQALISEQVIHTLGKPVDLVQMQVRRLWQNYFRVNVLVGQNITLAKIAKSYFVKADGDGNIVEATPRIVKEY